MKVDLIFINMGVLFLSIALLSACNGNSTYNHANDKTQLDSIPSEIQGNQFLDSSHLITALYDGLVVLPYTEYSGFSYDFKYNSKGRKISIKSSKEIESHKVDYFIILKDTAGIYSEDEFSEYDDSYKYIESYFAIDGKKIDLTNTYFSNITDEKTAPSLLWYDQDFGVSAKYYVLEKREIFLFRGLDLYCNGRQCTGYQLFVIQKEENMFKANTLYFEGIYPYDFENTFLFVKNEGGGDPGFFVPNTIDELKNVSDFDIFKIGFTEVRKEH